VQADAARRVFDKDRAFVLEALSTIEEISRESLEELGRMVAVLREEPNAEIEHRDLKSLDTLFARMQRLGLPLTYTISDDLIDIPNRIGRHAYSIIREGCSNVLRHAGRGVPTRVYAHVDARALEIEIVNEPPHKAPAAISSVRGRTGLRSIQERVREYGGSLHAGPTERGGYRLYASLPLERSEGL
jgi:signal transduction histidine kinase